MGYNSTIIVMNDALHEIKEDKDFGAKLSAAVQKLSLGRGIIGDHGVDISSGGHCNAATAIESHHADGIAVVAVGGNCATVLGMSWGNHLGKENKLRVLKQLADEMGYGLRKKVTK
tara:strand:+ start:151081 stop:151428 length:348 start_codon:yes stop_codon:yes gene_type:complete